MKESTELRAGRITAIRTQSRSAERVSLFIDGAFAFGMHRDLLLEFDLTKGMDLGVGIQRQILDRDAFFKARAVALRYLSYRDRAEAEVRRRLGRDDYAQNVIDDVVHDLARRDLIDDYRFARNYAESRFRSGGYGPVRIRADLRKKGVKRDAAESAISEVFSERDEMLKRARDAAAGRWSRLSNESNALKRRKKVYDFLARRGFRYELVRRVVDELEDQE